MTHRQIYLAQLKKLGNAIAALAEAEPVLQEWGWFRIKEDARKLAADLARVITEEREGS